MMQPCAFMARCNMFKNVHSHKKGNTHYARGSTTVVVPRDHTDYDFISPCKSLFDIATNNLAAYSGRKQVRVGGSLHALRVFNFGRETLTQVFANGLRAPLPMIDLNRVVLYPGTRVTTLAAHTPDDVVGLLKLAMPSKLELRDNVVVAQYFRLVAPTHTEIRAICRSMHFSEELVAQLERAPVFSTTTTIGDCLCLDLVTLTLIPSELFGIHDNVLEVFTNTMVSTKDTTNAPAHILDNTGVPLQAPKHANGVTYERSAVSNCVFVYHDCPTTMRFTHDSGMVTEIPQVQDHSRAEGFYKDWHLIDENGQFSISSTFIERSKMSNATGFFVRRIEAMNYMPKKEIEEIYNRFLTQQDQLIQNVRNNLRDFVKEVATGMEATRQTVERTLKDKEFDGQSKINKLADEIEKLKREFAKAEREKEDLRQENKELRSYKRELADVLKVVGSVVALGAVVLSQFKTKKK